MRTVTRDFRGVTLRIDWHIGTDVFDITYGDDAWERLTPWGLHDTLRNEVRLSDRTIVTLLKQLGRRRPDVSGYAS